MLAFVEIEIGERDFQCLHRIGEGWGGRWPGSSGTENANFLIALNPRAQAFKPHGRTSTWINDETISWGKIDVIGVLQRVRDPRIVGPAQHAVEAARRCVQSQPLGLCRGGPHEGVWFVRDAADVKRGEMTGRGTFAQGFRGQMQPVANGDGEIGNII